MSRIAVVGAGISGLTAAYLLSRRHDVLLFEREPRLGGHTHTHTVQTPDGTLALDTGFIVHNTRTYPLLTRLFDELGVERQDSDMSFGVSDRQTDFEYSTRDLNGYFADRRNLARPAHYGLFREILRFNRAARRVLADGSAGNSSLGEFLQAGRFGRAFIDGYLLPLASAIWSASLDTIRDFPAATLLRFFDNHGMITVRDHPVWRIVRGGSATYIPKLTGRPGITVQPGRPVRAVRRTSDGVSLEVEGQAPVVADHAVFACHGHQVLPLLGDPTGDERAVLSAFRSSTNEAWLHTDASLLPRRPAARASWNYLLGSRATGAAVTYYLNRLQRLDQAGVRHDYCVTLNPAAPIDPARVLARMTYTHPLYTREAVAAQARWGEISGRHRIHYCGAYWFYGFHEDGLRSAVRVAEALGVTW